MMGHGKHCNCMMCSMGKALCMIPKCDGKNCTDPSHQKDRKDTKKENDQEK